MTNRPIVMVTGASKGIGTAVARLFARNGYDVCINYLSDAVGARAVQQDCKQYGVRAIVVQADVSDPSDVAALFQECDDHLGAVTTLINNAGIIGGSSLLQDLTPDALTRTFEINVFGALYCIQEAIKRMSTGHGGQGGAIVNISSVAAVRGSPNKYVHYAATKGAVETLSIGAGKELAAFGIRVNAVRVGTTDTNIHAANGNLDQVKAVADSTPLGRIADPTDIAEAVFWLASDQSKFVTGTTLTVAGGLSV